MHYYFPTTAIVLLITESYIYLLIFDSKKSGDAMEQQGINEEC